MQECVGDVEVATSSNPNPKRPRRSDHFKLTFTNPQSLKTLVDIVSNILSECHFQVCTGTDGPFVGILIESIDNKQVCMITARLACQAEGAEDVFCVKMSTLNTLLRSVQSHCCVDVARADGSPDVSICSYETSPSECRSRFSLRTLAKEPDRVHLDDIDYEYTVEIDLVALRQYVKMAKDIKADVMEFVVEEPRAQHTDARHTYLKLSAGSDDVQMLQCFHSVTEAAPDEGAPPNVTIRTDACRGGATPGIGGENLRVCYRERFSVDYLGYFMKSMERHHLTMRLSSGKPLILQYPLGNEESYIRFVLAPRSE